LTCRSGRGAFAPKNQGSDKASNICTSNKNIIAEGNPLNNMAFAMVDSWKLVTIGMWVDKLERDGALSLICDTFDWDELWGAAAELNQQCAQRKMDTHIPRNRDQGELKDRVKLLGFAVLSSLQELKNLAEPPVFVVTSASLAMVPGVVKSNLKADPAVASRHDNMEKMLETLSKGFQEMKNEQKTQWPAIQVNGVPVQQPSGHDLQLHGQGAGGVGGALEILSSKGTSPGSPST
jgi:hypothetical protein